MYLSTTLAKPGEKRVRYPSKRLARGREPTGRDVLPITLTVLVSVTFYHLH